MSIQLCKTQQHRQDKKVTWIEIQKIKVIFWLFACTAGITVISICMYPIHCLHSSKLRLPGGVHVESRSFHTSRDTVHPRREIHHGLSTALHILYVVFYLFFVTVCQCILRRWCRRRWACQAHVHGGDVQRGGAHCTPLCHVLRPMVSEQLVPKFFPDDVE